MKIKLSCVVNDIEGGAFINDEYGSLKDKLHKLLDQWLEPDGTVIIQVDTISGKAVVLERKGQSP